MDQKRLEEKMAARGIRKGQMSRALGISRSAFYRKCTGRSQFTLGQVQKMMKLLELSSPVDIFFTEEVSERTQKEG